MSRQREFEPLVLAPIPKHAAPDFVISRAARRSRSLMQFLAVGFVFDPRRAEPHLNELAQATQRWLADHGSEEPSDAAVLTLLVDIVRDHLEARDSRVPLTLGLSAGFDARAIMWACERLGTRPHTFVYGQVGNMDYDVVHGIDARLGLNTLIVDTATLPWSLDQFDEATRWVNDLPISPRVPAAYLMDALHPGRDELHGYLNGVLTGGGRPATRVVRTWQDAVEEITARFNPFALQEAMPLGLPQSLFPRRPIVDPAKVSIPRQLAHVRMLERTRPSPGPGHRYLLPFEDPRWLGMWLAMPASALTKQHKWIRILHGLDSNLFFDIALFPEEHRRGTLRRLRIEHFYGRPGHRGVVDLDGSKLAIPENPTMHLSVIATYRNNPSFRRMVHDCWRRILGRGIFDRSFVNSAFLRFTHGESRGASQAMGLMSSDMAIEAGRIQLDG